MVDITDETHPFPVSTWQVPVGDFCEKGGRFGPHQHAETVNGEINRFEDKLAWVAYFNAGVRVVDLSDPYNLKEVGYYVPKTNALSHPITKGQPTAIQINDVDIDHRGLAYVSDRVGSGPVHLRIHRSRRQFWQDRHRSSKPQGGRMRAFTRTRVILLTAILACRRDRRSARRRTSRRQTGGRRPVERAAGAHEQGDPRLRGRGPHAGRGDAHRAPRQGGARRRLRQGRPRRRGGPRAPTTSSACTR